MKAEWRFINISMENTPGFPGVFQVGVFSVPGGYREVET
jgi:hypothetical protein